MGRSLIVRGIGTADFDQAARLLDEVFVGEGYTPDGYGHLVTDVAGRFALPATWTYVAEADGRLLGHVVVCHAGSPMVHLAGDHDAEIRLLATASCARGRGIGAALVTVCIEHARGFGRSRIVLSTQTTMDSAQRLYSRLGFRRVPAYDQQWKDRRLLAYELSL